MQLISLSLFSTSIHIIAMAVLHFFLWLRNIWPSNPSLAYLLGKLENILSQRYRHPYVHCNCPFLDDWMKKKWYIYTREYHPGRCGKDTDEHALSTGPGKCDWIFSSRSPSALITSCASFSGFNIPSPSSFPPLITAPALFPFVLQSQALKAMSFHADLHAWSEINILKISFFVES